MTEEHNTKVFEQYLFNNKQYKDMIANQANVFTNSGYSIPQKQITNVMNELIKTIGEHKWRKSLILSKQRNYNNLLTAD